MQKKMYSIIIPIYNAEDSLSKTLDSLINREDTKYNYEIILIDDGSKDMSLEIIKKYKKMSPNLIKYISTENMGPSNARNQGIQISSGEYIVFVDAGDYLDVNIFETINNFKESFDMLIFSYYIENQKHIYNNGIEKFDSRKMNSEHLLHLYKSSLLNAVWNKVYKKEILIKNKISFPVEVRMGEDLMFNLQYIKKTKDIYYLNQSYYYYYQDTAGSLSKQFNTDYFSNQLLLFEQVIDFFNGRIDDISIVNNTFISSLLMYLDHLAKKESYIKFSDEFNNEVFSTKSKIIINGIKSDNLSLKNQMILYLIKKRMSRVIYILFRFR